MSQFLDALSRQLSPFTPLNDPMAERTANKQQRLQAKNKELGIPDQGDNIQVLPYGSYNENSDGDNFGKLRLSSSQPDSSFDAWETKKPLAFYDTGTEKQRNQKLDKIANQMLALDKMKGLEPGTSTIEDVYAQGAIAKKNKQDLVNNAIANQDPRANKDTPFALSFIKKDTIDKSGNKRPIVEGYLPDGRNIADELNTPENNASFYSAFNNGPATLRSKLEQQAKNEINKDAVYSDGELEDNFGARVGNIGLDAVAGASDLTGSVVNAFSRAKKEDRKDASTNTDRVLFNSIQQKQKQAESKANSQDEFNTLFKNSLTKEERYLIKEGSQGSKTEKSFGAKLKDAAINALPGIGLLRVQAKLANKIDDITDTNNGSSTAFRNLQKEKELTDNISSREKFFSVPNKWVNQTAKNEAQKASAEGSGKEFSKAYTSLAKGLSDRNIGSFLKGYAKAYVGTYIAAGKFGKEVINSPQASLQNAAHSIPEMLAYMSGAGTAILGTSNFLKSIDDADNQYAKDNNGKKAEGTDRLKQVGGAAAISILQKGGAGFALGNFTKKIGLYSKPVTIKGRRNYNSYQPLELQNVTKGAKSSTTSYGPQQVEAAYTKVINNIDDAAIKTLDGKTLKFLKASAKVSGVTVKELLKSTVAASMVIGKNSLGVIKAGSGEYTEEYAEELIGQAINNIGSERSLDFMKAHIAGSAGFGAGAAIRSPVAGRTAIDATKAALRIPEKQKVYAPGKDAKESLVGNVEFYAKNTDVNQATKDVISNKLADKVIESKDDLAMGAYLNNVGELGQKVFEQAKEAKANNDPDAEKLAKRAIFLSHEQIKVTEALNKKNAEPLSEKTVNTVQDKDILPVLKETISTALDPKASFDNMKEVDNLISGKNVSAEIQQVHEDLNKGLSILNSEGTVDVTNNILTTSSKKNPTLVSIKDHVNKIETSVAEGSISDAKKQLTRLRNFGKSQMNKANKFNKFANSTSGSNVLTWSGQKYSREAAKALAPVMKAEAYFVKAASKLMTNTLNNPDTLIDTTKEVGTSHLKEVIKESSKIFSGKNTSNEVTNAPTETNTTTETAQTETTNATDENTVPFTPDKGNTVETETNVSTKKAEVKETEIVTEQDTPIDTTDTNVPWAVDTVKREPLKQEIVNESVDTTDTAKSTTKKETNNKIKTWLRDNWRSKKSYKSRAVKQRKIERESFDNTNPKTTRDAFQWAIDNAPDKETDFLLRSLGNSISNESLNQKIVFNDTIKSAPGYLGRVNRATAQLELTRYSGDYKNIEHFSYATLIHELVHVATSQRIAKNKAADNREHKELTRLRELVQTHLAPSGGPLEQNIGLKNNAEFMAELSNPKFRELLAKVKDPTRDNKTGSVLDSVIKVFKKVASKLMSTDLSKENTVLESVLQELNTYTNGSLENRATKVNNKANNGVLNVKPNSFTWSEKELASNFKVVAKKGNILSSTPDALNNLPEDIDEADATTLKEFASDVQIFKKDILKYLPNYDKNSGGKSYVSNDTKFTNVLSNFYGENGNPKDLPENFFNAITYVAENFLLTQGSDLTFNNIDTINTILGNPDGSHLANEAFLVLHKAGSVQNVIERKLGDQVLNILGIQEQETTKGSFNRQRLSNDIGNAVVNALVARGDLHLLGIKNSELDAFRHTPSINPNAYTNFIVPNVSKETTKGGFNKLHESIIKRNEKYNSKYRKTLDNYFGSTSQLVAPLTKPATIRDVPTNLKGSIMRVSSKVKKALHKSGQIPFHLNKKRFTAFNNLDRNTQLKLLGYQDTSKLIHHLQEGAEGKNRSIERDIDNLNTFINDHYEKDKPVYFSYRAWRNTRMGTIANMISMQQSKLHRQLFHAESWKNTVNFKNSKELKNFKNSVEMLSGGTPFNELVTNQGKVKDPDIAKAVAYINDNTKSPDTLIAAIDKLGEGMQGYTLLETIANFVEAKESGKESFEVTSYVETDGTTNGSISSVAQIGGILSLSVKRILNAGGVFFKEDPWKSYQEYKKTNNDNYQQFIEVLAPKIETRLAELSNSHPATFELLNTFLPQFTKEDGSISSEGRNFAKDFVMTFVYARGAESNKNGTSKIIQDTVFEYLQNSVSNKKELNKLSKLLNNVSKEYGLNVKFDFAKDAKNTTILTNNYDADIRAIIDPSGKNVVGTLVQNTLEDVYAEAVQNRTTINSMVQEMYQVSSEIFKYELQLAQETKGTKRNPKMLNEAEFKDFIKELINSGKLPTIKHATSENYEDSLLTVELENSNVNSNKAVPTKINYNTPVKRNLINKINSDGSLKIENKSQKSKSRPMQQKVLSTDTGLKPFLSLILSMDANVQASLMNGDKDLFNVHDAQLWGINDFVDGSHEANKTFFSLHKSWRLVKEVADAHDRMISHRDSYVSNNKINMNTFYPTNKARKNSQQLSVEINNILESEKSFKEQLFGENGISYVEQFANMGNGFKNLFTKKGKPTKKTKESLQEIDDYFNTKGQQGNQPDPMDLDHFRSVKNKVLNALNIISTMDYLKTRDSNLGFNISQKHSTYLDIYTQNVLRPMLTKVDKINYKAIENNLINKGAVVKNTIYQQLATKRNRVTLNMSNQEVLTHELTHIMWDSGLKKDKASYSKLRKYYLAVMNSKNPPTYKHYLPNPIGQNTKEEIIEAKKLYDYIYNSSSLSEFATYALTNETTINLLSNIRTPLLNKVDGSDPISFLTNVFVDVVNAVFKGTTADKALYDLAESLTHAQDLKIAESKNINPFSEYNNKRLANVQAEYVTGPVIDWLKNTPELYPDANVNIRNTLLLPARFVVSSASVGLNMVASPEIASMFRDYAENVSETVTQFAADLVNEMKTITDRNKGFHKILRYTKHYVEAAHIRIANGTTKDIRNRFHADNIPTKQDWEHLNNVVLRTDLASLIGEFTGNQINDLLTDGNKLAAKIAEYENTVANKNPNSKIHIYFAENLGMLMATGKPGSRYTRLNAINIAKMHDKKETKITDDLVKTIDVLATLQALRYSDKVAKQAVSTLFTNEMDLNPKNNGVVYLMDLANVAKQTALTTSFDNNPSLMRKGYINETFDNNKDALTINLVDQNNPDEVAHFNAQIEEAERLGYTKIKEFKNKDGRVLMYTNPSVQKARFMSGIVNITDTKYRGAIEVIDNIGANNKFNFTPLDIDKDHPIPIMNADGTEILNYRYEMSHVNKKKYLGMETDAAVNLGNTLASINTRTEAKKYNKEVTKLLVADFNKYFTNGSKEDRKNFVKVSKDNKYADIYKLIPGYMRKDLNDAFDTNGDIYINKDFINLVFGYRKKSLVNVLPESLNNEKTKFIKTAVFYSEKMWQSIVGTAKGNIVILTPSVLKNNVISNWVLSLAKGVPVTYMAKQQANALIETTKYRKIITKLDTVSRELKINPTSQKLLNQESRLQEALNNSPVHILMEEGLYSTIVEDIDNSETTIQKTASEIADVINSDKLNKIRNSVSKIKIPKLVTAVYKNSVITPDTGIAKNLREATQISDFVARYALYKYRTEEQGKPHEEALTETIDTFVNYDWNTNANMQWINDMGIMMYTKFLFRIQKVILDIFKNHPVNALSIAIAQEAIMDVPEITDSHLLGAVTTSRLGSPSELIDNAFEINLLHYLSWIF